MEKQMTSAADRERAIKLLPKNVLLSVYQEAGAWHVGLCLLNKRGDLNGQWSASNADYGQAFREAFNFWIEAQRDEHRKAVKEGQKP